MRVRVAFWGIILGGLIAMLCERCGGQYEAGKDSHLCVLPSGDDLAREIEAWFRTTRGAGLLGFAEWDRKHPKT